MSTGPTNDDEKNFWDEAFNAALNSIADGEGTDEEKTKHASHLADLALEARRQRERQ